MLGIIIRYIKKLPEKLHEFEKTVSKQTDFSALGIHIVDRIELSACSAI